MFRKINQRKARIDGRLDEYLQEEEERKEKGLIRRVFGKIGGGEAAEEVEGITKASLGGAWTLRDLNGKPFGSEDLAGRHYLLYFEGTLCPDVCPLTLMKIMKAIKLLQRSSEGKQYIRPVPVFVSVNPEKDTPAILAKFRDSLFGKDLVVLRGESSTSEELLSILRQFKVPVGLNEEEQRQMQEFFRQRDARNSATFFKRIYYKFAFWSEDRVFNSMDEAAEGFLNDHSRAMYLMAPDNKFITFYPLDLSEHELATQLMEDISYDIGQGYNGTD